MTRKARLLTALEGLTDGDHVGWVVDDPARFIPMTAEYLRQGVWARQKLFYFTPEPDGWPESLPIEDEVSVLDPHLAFLGGGLLDATAMYAGFEQETAKAVGEGYRGLRVMADMDWLLSAGASGRVIAAFEQGLDAVAAQSSTTVVCAYRPESFSARDLAGVICVHPYQLGAASEDLGFRIWSSGPGRWHVSGQVDLRAAEAFPAMVRSAAEGSDRLYLDCSELDFIDVAGIRALAQVVYSTGTGMRLRGTDEALRRSWRLLGFDSSVTNVEFCT